MADKNESKKVPGESGLYQSQLDDRGMSLSVWKQLRGLFGDEVPAPMILMAFDYCSVRQLDVMKRPVHILPFNTKVGNDWVKKWQIISGITELRITAARTGEYAGSEATEFGPDKTYDFAGVKVKAPEWARVTVYRIIKGMRCAFVGPMVLFDEAVNKTSKGVPTAQWRDRPVGMLEKTAESAALRKVFPEELGDDEPVAFVTEATPATPVTTDALSKLVKESKGASAQKDKPAADSEADDETIAVTGNDDETDQTIQQPENEEPLF